MPHYEVTTKVFILVKAASEAAALQEATKLLEDVHTMSVAGQDASDPELLYDGDEMRVALDASEDWDKDDEEESKPEESQP